MTFIGKVLKKGLQQFSYVKGLEGRIQEFEKYISFAPGHYYSPIVEPQEYIDQRKKFSSTADFLPAEINFNDEQQVKLLKQFETVYSEMPFRKTKSDNQRFSFANEFFTYADAITMYSMIRVYKPKKIIEIGSGFSSALLLDTNEHFFDNNIELIFIEPNPERLIENLRIGEKVRVIKQKIQEVALCLLQELEEGDFLLIDTSHVSKSGSDVNHIYFNILPYLKKGVKIHIHDIFFPFEYPEKWVVQEKRSWNEIFLLRSFLAFNKTFDVIFFNDYIEKKETEFIKEKMPLFLERDNTVCGGIWIEKNAS